MSISKNFVIKHGLEASTDLILADADTRRVGVGTTAPQYTLHVNGGIGATNFYLSGIGTFVDELNVGLGGTVLTVLGLGNSIGIGTALPAYLLDIRSPVSTGQTALFVQGDIRVTGDLNIDDISITNLNVSGISTFVGFATFNNNILVAGISTFVGFATFRNNILVAGISTFVGFATFRNNILVAGIGTVTTLNSTTGNITNLVSTSGTITNLTGTSATITTFNSTTGNITNLTNTNLNVSGISTFVGFATFQDYVFIQDGLNVTGTGATLASLNVLGVSTFVGFATFSNNIFVAGIGTVTTLNSTTGNITNLVSTSGTITNLTGTSATITTFNSTTGNITNLTNTNLNVTGIATIATLNATTVTISGAAVTNFTVSNNLSVGGISTFTNGQVLIGSGTSTGTASQKLQVTGGTYVSGNLGIGSTNPTSSLFVVGNARVTGVITATTFSGNVNAGVGTITTLGSTNGTITNLTGTSGTITTFNSTNGTITNLTGTNISYSGIGTVGSLNIASTQVISSGRQLQNIASLDATTTATIESAISNAPNTFTDLQVTGISTLGTVKIFSGIITATSGIVTYYGDGTYLTGTASSPGLQAVLNTGNTSTIGFNITGVSTLTTLNSTSGTITNISGTNLNYSGIGTITNLKGVAINISGIATAQDFDALSDENYKENVITVNNALNKVEQLRGVSFNWKENGRSSYGVIAQELQKVLPDLVKNGEIKSVNYNGIIGVLIEAVKELSSEVKELKRTK